MPEIDVTSQEFDEYMEWLVPSLDGQEITIERVEREFMTWKHLKSQLNDSSKAVPVFKNLPDFRCVTVQY